MLDHWVEDPEMPLLIRKGGMRGSVLSHSSGRIVVPTDNSPANWCFSTALQGRCPTLAETFMSLEAGHLPVAMMLKREEAASARYRGTLCARMEPPNLNRFGWKVCHLEGLGLNDSRSLVELPLETLKEHLRKFLHPRNMFLVPLRYSGVGELPEFLAVFRSSDLSNSAQE